MCPVSKNLFFNNLIQKQKTTTPYQWETLIALRTMRWGSIKLSGCTSGKRHSSFLAARKRQTTPRSCRLAVDTLICRRPRFIRFMARYRVSSWKCNNSWEGQTVFPIDYKAKQSHALWPIITPDWPSNILLKPCHRIRLQVLICKSLSVSTQLYYVSTTKTCRQQKQKKSSVWQ